MQTIKDLGCSSSTRPDFVVLGSGAIKGYYILGVLHGMHCNGLIDNVKGWSGVSVGSMISLLMISGFTPMDIATLAYKTKVFSSEFTTNELKEKIAEVKENMGMTSDLQIRNFLTAALEKKFTKVPTLGELFQITGIEFYSVTYNINTMKTVYLSHHSHPDMCSVDAVLLSINIPFLFYKKNYHNEVYIDGAFGDPLPVAPFDGRGYCLSIFVTSDTKIGDIYVQELAIYTQKVVTSSAHSLKKMIMVLSDEKSTFLEIVCPVVLDTTGETLNASERGKMLHHGSEAFEKYLGDIKTQHQHTEILTVLSPLNRLLHPTTRKTVVYYGDVKD